MSVGFLMPGQGSQSIGMGKVLADNFAVARDVFAEVDETLGEKLSELMFSGEEEKLRLTVNSQPAIMAVSMAVVRVMESEGLLLEDKVSFMAGHSLGEYSALCAAGVFSLSETARLLRIRSQAMQDAVPYGQGAMAAVLGLDLETVESICAQVTKDKGICEVANDNGGGQVVVSGEKKGVEAAGELLTTAGARKVIFLPVSAPFHCSLMGSAADKMEEAFKNVKVNNPSVPIIANVTVEVENKSDNVTDLLVRQIVGRVRWRETIEKMIGLGVTEFYEIGWGKVLTNITKRIDKNVKASSVYDPSAIEEVLKILT